MFERIVRLIRSRVKRRREAREVRLHGERRRAIRLPCPRCRKVSAARYTVTAYDFPGEPFYPTGVCKDCVLEIPTFMRREHSTETRARLAGL